MATVQDLLDRTLGKRGTTNTEPTQISNATLTERAGVGTFIPQLPKVLSEQRQNNIEYEKSKVDHANPLLTTANLNNSNPLISVPANALNMAGSVVANTIQGGRTVIGLGHEFVAKYHEAGLPNEAAVMQGSADSIEAELSVLRKELENPTVSGNPGARMKLIADITKKRAELIQANDTVRQSGYKDQIEAVKHNRKMGQLYADRTQGNSPDVLWNNKQRLEVNADIKSEIDQWKKENPDANFAEETAAASRITAGHLTDNPAEIIGSAVDSVAALLHPATIAASALSQGANFLIQQQEKYNEKKGIAGESLIPGGVQAGIAAGTAAYVGLNFYADKVLAKAAGLSKSSVDKAVEAATEVVAKGGTKTAAARTAAKVAAPTVKGAIGTGVLAAAQEYPVEGISAMMEENLGHGDWTFDGTVFGRGGTQGVMAGGVIAAPATAANTLEAASAQLNIKANESLTDTSSKKYNPVADIAQAYTDVVDSGAAATPEQVTAARDKAKTVLATTQERLDNLLQIKQDIKENDLTSVLAQRMGTESDSIQARFDNGEIDEATATSLMEGLDKKYNAYAAEVVKYRGKESKLDNDLRIVRNNLQASTQYHTKMSENVGLAPDTVKAIKDRQKIIESRTATPEDISRAVEDIIAYPMVATTKQIEQVVALGNLTPEVEKILRTISASKQLLQGETPSEVRKQIEHGAQGYRGLREYNEAFNVALIDNDEKAIGRIQRGLDSFLQSHTTKQQAISEALSQVPNGTTWQVARDKEYNWYVRKDNLFSEEKRKTYGAFNVHKGSGKLLTDVSEEVTLIQAQIDLVKASLELRQQAPVQPQDMTNYNKIKYSQKTPLTNAEAQAKVAKLEAALSPDTKSFAVGRDGNLYPVQVKHLHASDASKVVVSIDNTGKEYSPKLDDLVIMDQNGNDLFGGTEPTSEPVELDPQETSWDNLDESMPSDQDGDTEYDYTPADIDYGEPDQDTSIESTNESTTPVEQPVAETEPTQSTETVEASETEVTGQNATTKYSAANVTQELPVSDYVKSHIQTMRDMADKLGITTLIEDLAAQGKVASEIYTELVKDQLKSMNRKDAMDVIRATRTSLGIPSQQAGEEANNFQEWLKDYNKRKAAETGKAVEETTELTYLTVPNKLLNTSMSLHDPELKELIFKIKGNKESSGNLNYLSELYDSLVEAADDSTGIHIFTDVDSIPLDHIKELADTERYSNGHTTFYVRIPELGDIPMIFIDLRDGGELLSKASNPQEVIIHEIHHAITKENLEISSEIQDEINKVLKPRLVAHIEQNRERLEKDDPRTLERLEYMLTSNAEFLTVGTTEYGAIQELKKIFVPVDTAKSKTSMFTRLVQLIGKAMGMPNQVVNMYEKLLDQTAQLKEQAYVENQGELSNLAAVEGEVEAQSNEESDSDPRADVADTETQIGTKQVMYSGGAYGGDTLFDDAAWTAGIKRIHLTGDSDVVASKSLRQRGIKAVQVPKDKLAQAREQIKKLIGRTLQDNFTGNLHARNYYQVKDADAVYALAPMRKDSKGVLGGTDTAVQVGLALGKEVYVWDTNTLQWHSWDGSKFAASGLPPLRAKFAGVGTRDVEAYTTKDKATGQWVTNPKYLGDSVRTAAQEAVTALLKQKVEAPNDDTVTKNETEPTTLNIWAGSNENTVLSNFADRPFRFNGIEFKSVEHAFQLSKAVVSNDLDAIEKLRKVTSADQAKKLGHSVQMSADDRKRWDEHSATVMKELIRESFKQNPDALEALLNTGDAVLTHTQEKGKWGTEFPRILMEVRSELRGTTEASIETVPTETEVETETETSTVQRTVKGSFYLDSSDTLTEGTIDIADGSVIVRVGDKEVTVKVTPEQLNNETRLAQAILRADSNIELAYSDDLVPKEIQLARAQEIYGDDVSLEEIQQLNRNAEDEIISREDGTYDEVKVEDAKGLLEVFLDEASTFTKNFRQVGSKLYAKPFITIKDFFPTLDWNAPKRAEYLAQLLASDTSKLDDHDFTTMKALRDFHMGMSKGNSFRDVVLDRLNNTEQLDPKLNLASHLVVQTEDGKLAFEENVLGAMSVAAYDYILKNQDMLVNSDAGINFMLSIPVKDSFIKGAAAEKYRRSTALRDKVIYGLGESVTTALGIKVNNDVSPDELRKLNSALGIYVYDAMKGRFITEKVVYEHQILTDVANHIGYTTARERYNKLMEAADISLPFKDFRKLHKQYVETIKENRIGYISQKGSKPEGILDFATKVTKNMPRIPTFRPENLVGNPKEVQAFIEVAQQLRAVHGVLNTPKYLAGIAQEQNAIDNNKRQRKNPNYKPQQELARSVSKVTQGVPSRSDTIHKIFGLDKSLITPLSAPVRFLQRTIKKSLAEVSDAQAKVLDAISQKPLKIKPFTSVVSNLAEKDYELLKDIIGANPALDTIHISHRDNEVAKAANIERELELALGYVDSITNEDGSYNNFYHELVVWSNNRFGYRSNTFNLQTSKIARSMSTYVENVAVVKKTVTGTSTRSIFNKDKQLTEYGKLLHGVAVYAEDITTKNKVKFPKDYLGDTTVDKAPNEVLLPLLHKRLTTEFKAHFDAVRKLVNNETLESTDRSLITELVGEMGAGIQSLEAAVELVRYWDTPKGKTFESHLTVESDGITNGMIINQIQNGTATLDMLVQAGLLTDAELADNPDADFFQLKGYGWLGKKLTDYYVRAGNHQKENWVKLVQALSLETFDDNASEDSNIAIALAFIDATFGERKGAKAFATPDNYAAGLGRIKEIVGEFFTDNLISSIEKSINNNDPEKLGTIMKHVDTLLKFHDTYLTSPDMVNVIYKKGGVPVLNVTVPEGMSQKQLRANLAKRAVLMANSTGAEQGKIFQLKAKDLNSYREMIDELSAHFSINVMRTFRIEKLDPVTDMNMGQLDQRLGMIIAATKHMFTAVPVGTLDYNFINSMTFSSLMDVKFISDEQMSALNAVSNVTQGTATVLALREMNGEFYRVREANLEVMNAAYRVHQVIRREVINQAISRRLTKMETIPENYKGIDAESLLTVNDWKEINQILSKFLPTGQTAFSRKSKNSQKSGAVFLDEGNKLFTSETYTQEVAITKDGKTTKYKTGVYKPVDKPVGLKGNSSMTQSVDAYVTTNASTKVISGNFHDSNGYNIASYQEGAKAQNEVFFEALVNHSAQNGFAEAVLNPLKAFLEDSSIKKSQDVLADLNAMLTGKNDISGDVLIMYTAELDRLSLLSAVSRVQQYGTEDGHYDVPQEVRDQIQKHLDNQRSADTPMIQLMDTIANLQSKVKNPPNPSKVYELTDAAALVEQEMADYESGNSNLVIQGLRDLGSTNIPASKVVGLIKEHLNNHEGELHPFYSQLIDLVEAALPSGIEVNMFTPTRIPNHVRGDRVLQYERDTQGWFTGNQVNLVYSARNELTVETLVHELVHAALVDHVKQGLKGKDKNPAATDLINLMANVRGALEADPRFADIVADYQVALQNVHEFVSYGITNQRFMNALKSVYIPQTSQHKSNSKHSIAKRLVNAFSRFTELAVELLLGKTPKYKGKGKDAHINALAALTTTVALNLQEASMSNAKPDMDFDTVLQHVANANAKSKEKIKLMTPTQVYEKLNTGNLSSAFDQQLRTDVLPLLEAIAENINATEVGKMFKESVDPETIWDNAQVNNKVPYISSLLGMGFPLSDKEAYTVETLEAALNAIIDYSYGSTVHREMDRMYMAARNNLKPEHFHEGDWAKATIREKIAARERWNQLFNLSENMDNERRNRFLTRFMALSLGSEHFNKMLNNVPPTQDVLEEHETVHGFIANRFHRFIDWLAQRAARTGNIPTIQGRIKVLAEQLAEIDAKRKNHLMHKASKNPFGNLDGLGDSVATAVRNSIVRLARLDPIQNSSLNVVKLGSESLQLLAKNNLEEVPDQIMKLRANTHPSTLPGFLAETAQEMGRPTGLRKKLISMISRNNAIQRERETMRQHIEKNITEMFVDNGDYLETEDWKAITNVVLRTGLSRLYFEEYEPNVIFDFISSTKSRRDEISELEDQVLQLADGSTKLMRTKQLADYMVTGVAHELQAKNTLQIAGSVGVSDSAYIPDWFDTDVKLLNRLVSLYAIEYSDKEDIQRIKKVLEKESLNSDNGVERLLNFHQKLGNDSRDMFVDNPLSQAQAYVPEIHNTNREIAFAAHDGDMEEMVKLGYQEVTGGTLKKADYDTNATPVRMMYTMNSDKQRIVDGVAMLNTTDGKGTEIAIEDINVVTEHLARKLRKKALHSAKAYDPRNDREVTHGVPQLNAEGEVVGMAYEMTNALRDSLLERDNHPAKLMGEYAASNLDLQNVEKVNFPVMDALFQDYQFNYKERPQDYVELSHESDNPELVRMYRMLPYTTREYLKSLYGESPIMVNANVLTITLGYRKYTPTEVFRKNPDERNVVEATFAGMMQAMFQDKAAVRTTQALKATMEIVKLIKDFYVIRNFTTLFNNILSNNAVLLAYGVSPLALARDTKVALQAGLKFKKDYSLYIQYKTKVALGLGDMIENKQKMMYYEDSLQRNPLKAFIDEGMMTSVVEDIEQSKDDYSYQAALENKFKGTIEAIPKPIRETVNFVMVNQGTPLHRMLTDTTAMSDFVAKYVLYNYHTKKKGMSHAEAIFESHEAFINYEVPTNKTLQFLNDIGLVMFTKYALRIQRVVYRLLRDKPASVILQSYLLGSVLGMPTALDGFIPHTGNLPFSGSVTEAFSALGEPIPLKLVF